MAGLAKEDVERAHRFGRFDMGVDGGSSDSDSPTEKKHQEGLRRAAAWLWRQVRAAERVRYKRFSLAPGTRVSVCLWVTFLTAVLYNCTLHIACTYGIGSR